MKNKRLNSVIPILIIFFSVIYRTNGQSRLYISNDDHTDYMWTAKENAYRDAFLGMLDWWIIRNNATANNPPDFRSKFNADGTFWAWEYEKNRSPAQFQALMEQVKSERIILPMNPLIVTYGCIPAEAAIRGMYYAGELQRRFDLPMDMAMSMENQVMPLGTASLWRGCGAKYAWHGICNCATKLTGLDKNRDREIYWYKGLDDQKILMKWYSLPSGNNQRLGGYAEIFNPKISIADLAGKVNTPAYNYNIAGAFGVGWDNLSLVTDSLVAAAQDNSTPTQRVIMSNQVDFFRDFETTYGATLPSKTVTFGNEWEAGCASLAEVSAKVKRALIKMRAAEAMATIVAKTNPSFATTLDALRKEAWMAIGLYWEHDFGGNGPGATNSERAVWQRRVEQTISSYTNQLFNLSKANFANQIKKTSKNPCFFVFNPLSWVRTDYADFLYSGQVPVHVINPITGNEVKSQIIIKNGLKYLRILAENVPSIGYKTFEIKTGISSSNFQMAAKIDNTTQTINNDFYAISFTKRGVITSLIDKVHGNKQLVNNTGNKEFINNIGLNENFAGNANSSGSFTVINAGSVSFSVKIVSKAVINHITNLTVFKDIPRIEIDNKITENFGNDFLYNTFSFDRTTIGEPVIWHEENGAILKAKREANGGHYADRQARYDWITLNNFAAVTDDDKYGITLSNQDCYFLKAGNSTENIMDESTANLRVLVGGRVDGIGMENQDFDTEFNQRYALNTFHNYSEVNAMKSALEHQNSFVTGEITNTSGNLPEKEYSFLTIPDPNTLLWSLKPTEEGMDKRGVMVRVWNLSDTNQNVNLIFNDNIANAKNISHIETDISDVSFTGNTINSSIGKHQIKSYRAKLLTENIASPPLAIEFKGINKNKTNKLSWRVEKDVKLSGFEIERSIDGNKFDLLAKIKNNNIEDYTFNDDNVNPLIPYYYRLKSAEKNESKYNDKIIIVLADEHSDDILIFPNPVKNVLKFHFISNTKSNYTVKIVDSKGAILQKAPSPLFEIGSNYFTLPTQKLPIGSYSLVVSNGDNKYTRKFLKQ